MSDAAALSANDLVERGRALHREGRLDEAERLYAQALEADEYCAEAHQLMAVLAGQRGRLDEAIAGFRRTIALEGPTPDRLFNLAEAYRVHGDFNLALDAYNQALTLDAGYLDAFRSCAAMIAEAAGRARTEGDAAAAQRLGKLAGHYLSGLGHACLRAADVAGAERAYREAIALDPVAADALNCLGTIALEAARPVEAETFYRRACEIEPDSPLYLSNLGRSLLVQVRLEEAAGLFQRAIEADPTFSDARAYLEEGMLRWLHFRTDRTPAAVFGAHRDWGRKEIERAAKIGKAPRRDANSRDPDRPLKVAYVGLDTGSRLARSCFEPLIANHNPREFKSAVYATAGSGVAELRHFKALAGEFRAIPLKRPQETIKLIKASGIDIMIDIAGHMPHNRLDIFAHRPAPVTATWLGYPDTTGLLEVDYRITDEVSDPPGAEQFHTERLYRLPGGSLAYRPPKTAPDVTELQASTSGAVTFANFDDPRKISLETARTWGIIFGALPAARLLLLAPEFADKGFAEQLRSRLASAGIDVERVELRYTPERLEETLRAYSEVDIALDTFPYNAAPTTMCEALWMGVTGVTLSGDRSCARTSASLLSQVGLERLDSHTPEEYAETAIELAQDLVRLRMLRSGMRERMRVSPLMDERGFARRFEAALRDMWRQWCKSGA